MPVTDDPQDPRLTHGTDSEPVTQAEAYLVLSEEERAKGFVRPLRTSYRHLACGTVTTMSLPIAESYARQPGFYGATYCCRCMRHLPVGVTGEFLWIEQDGSTGPHVGTLARGPFSYRTPQPDDTMPELNEHVDPAVRAARDLGSDYDLPGRAGSPGDLHSPVLLRPVAAVHP